MQLMVSGTLGIVANGITMAAVILILASLLNTIRNDPSGNFIHDINKFSLLFLYFSIGLWFAALLEAVCWARTAERQASRMRTKYLKAVLTQEEGFFDTQGTTTSQVVSSVTKDTEDDLVEKA